MGEPLTLAAGADALADVERRSHRVTLGTGLGYGLGMVGERLFRDAPALLLLVFMTNFYLLTLSLVIWMKRSPCRN